MTLNNNENVIDINNSRRRSSNESNICRELLDFLAESKADENNTNERIVKFNSFLKSVINRKIS